MELRDFVATALVEIAEAVVRAQEALSPLGAKVNPKIDRLLAEGENCFAAFGVTRNADGDLNPVLLVDFDVAVTASEGTKTKGGIGVVTGLVSLGSTGATDKAETAVSHLSFKIPLSLPLHGKGTSKIPS